MGQFVQARAGGPRQLRVQARCARSFHQFRNVVESMRRALAVLAQRLQGHPQLPGRLPSGLLDRQQGLRHLFTALAGQVDGASLTGLTGAITGRVFEDRLDQDGVDEHQHRLQQAPAPK
ncbi:hypothetical protein GCM10009780_08000 [Actinomadura alba]